MKRSQVVGAKESSVKDEALLRALDAIRYRIAHLTGSRSLVACVARGLLESAELSVKKAAELLGEDE